MDKTKSAAVLGAGKRKAMAIAAHPDDIEFMMAGTLMRLGEAGWELHYMNIANGCCGSLEHDAQTTAAIRADEARKAAEILGAQWYLPLTGDLEVFYNDDLLRRLAAIIRQVAPEILLIHSPVDYMEDHMNACRLAVSAAFARGMPNYQTDPPVSPVSQEVTLYHAMPHELVDGFGDPVKARMFVDVGDLMERKRAALSAHASQKEWLDVSQGMDSYLKDMEKTTREMGRQSGMFECAEGWRPHAHMGFCERGANPMKDALGKCFTP
jgi:LmbE family N-acetylglucosaminyl deacetylase